MFLDIEFTFSSEKTRLDIALKDYFENISPSDELYSKVDLNSLTRSKLSKFISSGFVKVNDDIVTKAGLFVSQGDNITLSLPINENENKIIGDSNIKINIIYEDDDLLVINKQAGLIVHPGAGNETGTLCHGLVAYLGENILQVGHPLRPGIVHRLDKETSGLMLVAKNFTSYQALTEMFLPPRKISRHYVAVVDRLPDRKSAISSGTIDIPIARHPNNRTKMLADKNIANARHAITHWKLLQELDYGFLLELQLETGRTHQIRAHLQAKNSSIICDDVYGFSINNVPNKFIPAVKKLNRVALHAKYLEFPHPCTNKTMQFECDFPSDILELIDFLKK